MMIKGVDLDFFWPKCDLSAMYVNDEEKSKLIWQPSDPAVVLLWESLKSIREQSFNLFLSRSSQMSGVSSISPELQFSEMDICSAIVFICFMTIINQEYINITRAMMSLDTFSRLRQLFLQSKCISNWILFRSFHKLSMIKNYSLL